MFKLLNDSSNIFVQFSTKIGSNYQITNIYSIIGMKQLKSKIIVIIKIVLNANINFISIVKLLLCNIYFIENN
jgi:hypothetical protein